MANPLYSTGSECVPGLTWLTPSILQVLNVSRDCQNHFPDIFEYLNLPVEDRVYADISQHFSKALQFIGRVNVALSLYSVTNTPAQCSITATYGYNITLTALYL